MERADLLNCLARRSGGEFSIAVTGPVLSGKSTFINRVMQASVLPRLENEDEAEGLARRLPLTGTGREITTIEPQYIPEHPVLVEIDGRELKVQLVDCLGEVVEGARGHMQDGQPRRVFTPWTDEKIGYDEAVTLCVEHAVKETDMTVVVTTDGSFGDLSRQSIEPAEEKVIAAIKETGKPTVIVLNTANPASGDVTSLRLDLETKYDIPVVVMDCLNFEDNDVFGLLEEALYEFPVVDISIDIPEWVDELDKTHWLKTQIDEAKTTALGSVRRMRDVDFVTDELSLYDFAQSVELKELDLGDGTCQIHMSLPDNLFFKAMGEVSGLDIQNKAKLLRMIRELAHAKREYDRLADALRDAQDEGYGIVPPILDEMVLDEPEIVKQGNRFGVRLRASVPSFHIIKVNVQSEVAPIVGTERQSEELVKYLIDEFEENPKKLWEANIFGKSLQELVKEGIQNKLYRMPEKAQAKLQDTLQKIVNEGGGGLIAIIL